MTTEEQVNSVKHYTEKTEKFREHGAL